MPTVYDFSVQLKAISESNRRILLRQRTESLSADNRRKHRPLKMHLLEPAIGSMEEKITYLPFRTTYGNIGPNGVDRGTIDHLVDRLGASASIPRLHEKTVSTKISEINFRHQLKLV